MIRNTQVIKGGTNRELFIKDNLRKLLVEIYKSIHYISPTIT